MSESAVGRLMRRVQMAVGIGRITAPVDDKGVVQSAQVRFSHDEVRDRLAVLQYYGVASVPPIGADVVAVFLAGDRSNGVVVAHGNQGDRPRGQKAGEASLYNGHGMRLHLSQDGPVLDCGGKPVVVRNATTATVEASEKIVLAAPFVEVTGDLRVAKDITAKDGGLTFSTHGHTGVRGGTETSGPPRVVPEGTPGVGT